MIYLDSAATSFHKPKQVAEAVVNAMNTLGSSGRGGHGLSVGASRELYKARQNVAKLFHMKEPLQVAFTLNATESLNAVINGLIHEGDHVVTTVYEHNSVLRPLYAKKASLTIVGLDDGNSLDYSQFSNAITPQTKAVIVTHASNVTGDIVNVGAIGEICKKRGVPFIVDCAQTAGVLDINIDALNIDIVCASAHKGLLGPQGVGIVCVADSIDLPPFKRGGSGTDSFNKNHPSQMPERFEAGTQAVHSIAGLSAGVDYILQKGTENIYIQSKRLHDIFLSAVADIPAVKIYGNYKNESRIPNISLNIGELGSQEIAAELWDQYEIAVRGGAHCAPLIHEANMTERQGMARFSFCHFNTEDEVLKAISAIKEVVS